MGIEDLSLSQVGQGVFGVLVTLLIVYIVSVAGGPAYAEGGQGTQTSLGKLHVILSEFDKGLDKDGFYLVAFDADNSGAIADRCTKSSVLRPDNSGECLAGRACICLCVEGMQCRGGGANCKSFDNIKRITLRNLANDNFIGPVKAPPANGNDLLLYGDCGVGWATMRPTVLYIYNSSATDREIIIDSKAPVRNIPTKK
jgi:hypothetical protein